MANKIEKDESPATEREVARDTATPAPVNYLLPRNMDVERVGNLTSGVTQEFPRVRGGVCDWCGVLDPKVESKYQYKLCPHYRGKQLSCSYCPETKDVDDVIYHANLRVLQHPEYPNRLIIHCDSYECLKKHEARWKVAN